MNLHANTPEMAPDLINRARRIARSHGYRMIRPTGRISLTEWGLGMFRLVDAEGSIVAGHRHELAPADVARYFGEEL
jgi:hypothetical protein